jgi:uncharacterized membrane protein
MIGLATGKHGIERRQHDRTGQDRAVQPLADFARPAHASNPRFEIRYYCGQCALCQAMLDFFWTARQAG